MTKTYVIASIPIAIEYCFDPYLKDSLKRYEAPGVEAKYRLRIRCEDTLEKPAGAPTFTKGRREIHLGEAAGEIVVSDSEGVVRYKVRYAKDYTDVSIVLAKGPEDKLAETEYVLGGLAFIDIALMERRLALHASAIVHHGKAVLFAAPSQTGKSTLARHWLKTFEGDADIINDDKPLIYEEDGVFHAAGSPFCGKDLLNRNVAYPIRAVVFLKQGAQCRLERPSAETVLKELLRNAARPSDETLLAHMLDVVERLIASGSFYEFHGTKGAESARYLHERLMTEGRT